MIGLVCSAEVHPEAPSCEPTAARQQAKCINSGAQVFFAKVPRAATEAEVMALFAGLGSVEDVVLFKASGAQHHKVGSGKLGGTRGILVLHSNAAEPSFRKLKMKLCLL